MKKVMMIVLALLMVTSCAQGAAGIYAEYQSNNFPYLLMLNLKQEN